MLSNDGRSVAITALAPLSWGTTYLVTSELLPAGRPLLAAVLRAMPAGLFLLALTRTLPRGAWWWKAPVLGGLNIGVFFALLFAAAYRLPGGVAATIGSVQPLIVAVLASRLVGEALTLRRILAGAAGMAGVALLVMQSTGRLDAIGIGAALGGATAMAAGTVLSKRWGQPASALAVTSWQLVSGAVLLIPILLSVEGLPTQPLSSRNVAGFAYLALIGTALAYTLWFRGIQLLPVGSVTFLGLLSPVVAVMAGWAFLAQTLSWGQILGTAIILTSLTCVFTSPRPHSSDAETREFAQTRSA
ncbi:MAG: EamA family transporter [Actinomycetota bacterium]